MQSEIFMPIVELFMLSDIYTTENNILAMKEGK